MTTRKWVLALCAGFSAFSAQAATDVTAPVVTTFSIPATAGSLSIPVTRLAATDNVGVAAYFVSETATKPSAAATGWMPAPPTSYKAASAGTRTLYAWARDKAGNISAARSAECTVTLTPAPVRPPAPLEPGAFTLEQTLSDGAQLTTLAFDGLAILTGNLNAKSFFPPGKVADYTGFQYLRDNDQDGMGHNTDFLTRAANNVLYVLTEEQIAKMKALAARQAGQVTQYALNRYPLMNAFNLTVSRTIPSGSTGLNLNAVKAASKALYQIDGQISFDRAKLYATLIQGMTASQRSYLLSMRGTGFNNWPDIGRDSIQSKIQGLAPDAMTLVMTYAGDLFSWFTGSVDGDVYFCPERHGTYFGAFYMKDAPAVGHAGYGISTTITNTAGQALSNPGAGYVNATQAGYVQALLAQQDANLDGIVAVRTRIATLLRKLIANPGDPTVLPQVLTLSGTYGELDGANNHHYATAFAKVAASLTPAQVTKLKALRSGILTGKYADGAAFDFTTARAPYLYATPVADTRAISPYVASASQLFFEP